MASFSKFLYQLKLTPENVFITLVAFLLLRFSSIVILKNSNRWIQHDVHPSNIWPYFDFRGKLYGEFSCLILELACPRLAVAIFVSPHTPISFFFYK